MTRASKLLGATGLSVLAALGATPAMAAGTQAGSTITNTATVNYTVGGVAQTAATASDTFTVDRKVNVTVATTDTSTVSVAPGRTDAVTTFTVTNTSNATLDFLLTPAQLAAGTAAGHTNTDSFDGSNLRMYVESDGVAGYSAGDTQVTYIDELAADTSKTVYILLDIAANATNNGVAGVSLTAKALEGGGTGTQGAALVQTTTANTAAMDTVFADAAGAVTGDVARDAQHSAKSDYTIAAALLTASKISTVISDPVNGTTNPKMIPGAVVQYCIAVANATGGAAATLLSVADPLPANVTYDTAYGVKVGGTKTGSTCTAGALPGTYDAVNNRVNATIALLAANSNSTVVFQVTVN